MEWKDNGAASICWSLYVPCSLLHMLELFPPAPPHTHLFSQGPGQEDKYTLTDGHAHAWLNTVTWIYSINTHMHTRTQYEQPWQKKTVTCLYTHMHNRLHSYAQAWLNTQLYMHTRTHSHEQPWQNTVTCIHTCTHACPLSWQKRNTHIHMCMWH